MVLGSLTSSAMSGLQRAEAQLDRAAAQTFDATVPTDRVTLGSADDFIAASVARSTAALVFQANLKTLKVADEMSAVVIDLLIR